KCKSRDSSVGITTGYGLDDRGFGFFSPGLKRQGRETDQSPPARAEVKKLWIYTSSLPYVFMA
ncbi:hypothetical protein B7P43_G12504, partial [Cryptotermes secundus]